MHSIMNPQGLNIARPPCCPRLPPGSGLREVSAGALRSVCRPPSTSPRLLDTTSRRPSCCHYPPAAVPANKRNSSYSPGRWNRPSILHPLQPVLDNSPVSWNIYPSTALFRSLTDRGLASATSQSRKKCRLIPIPNQYLHTTVPSWRLPSLPGRIPALLAQSAATRTTS